MIFCLQVIVHYEIKVPKLRPEPDLSRYSKQKLQFISNFRKKRTVLVPFPVLDTSPHPLLYKFAKTRLVSHKRLLASGVATGYLRPFAGCFRCTVLDWLHEETVNAKNSECKEQTSRQRKIRATLSRGTHNTVQQQYGRINQTTAPWP